MLHPCHYIVMDFETSGWTAKNNQAVSIAVVVLNQALEEVEVFSTYINYYDGKKIESSALAFNGVTIEQIESGMDVLELYKLLKEIFKKYKCGRYAKPIMVGHNFIDFDLQFLEYIFSRVTITKDGVQIPDSVHTYISSYIIDTMERSRELWGLEEVEDHKLPTTCKRAGIELFDAHNALNDTKANAELLKYFIRRGRGGSAGETIVKVKERVSFKY